MSIFPRRRSYLLKFLLLIPAVWFFAVILFAYGGGGGNGPSSGHNHKAVEKIDNNNELENRNRRQNVETNEQKIKSIQGFGPPLSVIDVAESLGEKKDDEKKNDNEDVDAAKNIPKPKKFAIDPNSPIYKTDPNMPGELGKPVNVNKNVSDVLFFMCF